MIQPGGWGYSKKAAIEGYERRIKELEIRIKEYRDEINRLKGQQPIQRF